MELLSRRGRGKNWPWLKDADQLEKGVPHIQADTIRCLLERHRCICGAPLEHDEEKVRHLMELIPALPPNSISQMVGQFAREARQHARQGEGFFEEFQQRVSSVRSDEQAWNRTQDEMHLLETSLADRNQAQELQHRRQQAKQQSEKDFNVWQNEEGKWAIRDYDGDKNVGALVIPSKVSGIPIDTIETGAFSGLSVGAVVLPSSLKSVEDEAFSNCEPFDLYLYDSLGSFGENPFGGCVKTLYLNAILPPSFLDLTYEPSVADRVDALLLSKGKKRLILLGRLTLQ